MIKSLVINPLFQAKSEHIASKLNYVIDDGFYSVIEIWDSYDIDVWNIISKNVDCIDFDISLSPFMYDCGLDIISQNIYDRRKAKEHIFERLKFMEYIGINNVSISSPRILDYRVSRQEQVKILLGVMSEICEYACTLNIDVSFEPFDVSVDKKRLLGKSEDVLQFIKAIDPIANNLFITWDLAHFCLESEDYQSSFRILKSYIKRIHLSNYSLDQTKWYFGDKHIPFDGYGAIDQSELVSIITMIKAACRCSVAFEVASNESTLNCDSFNLAYEYNKSLFSLC